jgi:hypothetical protein
MCKLKRKSEVILSFKEIQKGEKAHLKRKSEEITLRIPFQANLTIYKGRGHGSGTNSTLQVHRP